ncbi:hypothetical protein BAZSYMA_ACONTIG05326_2 [Bathymodiolus azoricus thioautotrophic gill symbiont]|uniref:Uncharacterized protein n=1 Tax=Bathymodiolus azoricus thioautotrophic gill symbiont TaxID=235205 RepID=A0A1H6KSB9_9GAMM|nr:hypothetical protein BAZSYMA_ACONTIG05326_2 [Bathymodiolus azoricus thioautotrophic gill symbiont]
MSWKNTQQNSFADSLVIEHKSLSELDDVHNTIFKNKRYKYGKIISF